jgi:membrane associated rhomboid family serine protease
MASSPVEFAATAGTLVGGMFAVPTQTARHRPLVAGWFAVHREPFTLTDEFIRNLVYSPRNVEAGRWWTQFTYAFVHRDDEHLLDNVTLLLPHAYHCHTSFGSWWVAIFFGGVWAGAHKTVTKRFEAEQMLSEPLSLRRSAPDALRPAADALDGVTRRVARWLAPSHMRSQQLIGASAGVWALMGASLGLSAERMVAMMARGQVEELVSTLPMMLLANALTVSELIREASALESGQGGAAHAAHIDGFLFGLASYIVLRAARARPRRRQVALS